MPGCSTLSPSPPSPLNETILHGRVQDVVQRDALSLGLEVYAHHARPYLYLTAHPTDAHVHLEVTRQWSHAPLLLLLCKYIKKNAFIDSLVPLPYERVLKIECDHARAGVTTLGIETTGRYSNIILLDADGVVLDALSGSAVRCFWRTPTKLRAGRRG